MNRVMQEVYCLNGANALVNRCASLTGRGIGGNEGGGGLEGLLIT
jgi:hypothetical protein